MPLPKARRNASPAPHPRVGWLSVALLLLLPSLAAPGTPLLGDRTARASVRHARLRGVEARAGPSDDPVRTAPLFLDRPLEAYGVMRPAHLAHLDVDLTPR